MAPGGCASKESGSIGRGSGDRACGSAPAGNDFGHRRGGAERTRFTEGPRRSPALAPLLTAPPALHARDRPVSVRRPRAVQCDVTPLVIPYRGAPHGTE